jgi:NADH:ubiquinone reductase (non-electrogenic)
MPDALPHICILGGGFGGLYTALRLDQFPWNHPKPIITLIDHHDRFLFTPLLYELVTEELQTWEIAPPYEELLSTTAIRFFQADITGIDLEQRQVTLSHGTLGSLTYDRLVLALGGEAPMDIVPGAAEYALAFRSLKDAYRLNQQLRWLESSTLEPIRVAVVGASYSGVELACKLAKRLGDRGRIQLIQRSDKVLPTSAQYNRQVAQKPCQP